MILIFFIILCFLPSFSPLLQLLSQLPQNPLQVLADGGLRDAIVPCEFFLRRMEKEMREDEGAFFV